MKPKTYAIILCGGSGTRLWPRSRSTNPKHLLSLNGAFTLVQQTVKRVELPPEQIFCITEVSHAELLREQLPEIPGENIIVEPGRRGTASAIGLVFAKIRDRLQPDDVLAVLPADAMIDDDAKFSATLGAWTEAAAEMDRIITLGIRPTYPSTGFGYINFGKELTTVKDFAVCETKRFVEKPTEEVAKEYLETGKYLWNAGMFAFTVAVFEREMKQYMPKLLKELIELVKEDDQAANRRYLRLPNEPIEYGLMEKTKTLAVIPASFGWADLGSWADLHDLLEKDPDGNVFEGEYVDIDSHNCFVYSPNHLVATIGLDNLVIINTGDAVLICPKDRSQDVKKVVEQLKKRDQTKYL